MRWAWAISVFVATSSWASGGVHVLTAPGELPPELVERVREGLGAEPLHARKVVEGDRVCYLVTARDSRGEFGMYASPDGNALVRKTEEFSLAIWGEVLVACAVFLLVPGLLAGASTRWVVRAGR
ncbi:MAG TPA: hypothetical protein VD866_33360, partial [Urbifossiella sp.]|nr:hypothetical protein [Urbifossiella sp.]